MFYRITSVILAAILMFSCNSGDKSGNPENLGHPENFMDSVSYAIGKNIAVQMSQDSIDFNVDYLTLGFMDGKDTTRPQMFTMEQVQDINFKFQMEMQKKAETRMQKEQEQMQKKGAENSEMGSKLIEETKAKSDWNETSSGLLYKVVKEGSGENPKVSDLITVHMIGSIPDGSEFENTYDNNNEPVEVPVFQMVPGMQEAMMMLKPGSKYEFIVPSEIAFGAQGIQGAVPPNTPVILTLEMISKKDGSEQFKQFQDFQQQQQMMQQQQMQGNNPN